MANKKKKVLFEIGEDGREITTNKKTKKKKSQMLFEVGEDGKIATYNQKDEDNFAGGFIKKSKYFDDGYQVGDGLKTAGSTLGSFAADLGEGFLGSVEGGADWVQYKLSDALKKMGADNAANSLKENAKFNSTGAFFGRNENDNLFGKGWADRLKEGSTLGDTTSAITQGIGQIGAMAGTSYLGGAVLGGGAKAIGVADTAANANKIRNISSAFTSYTTSYGRARSEAYEKGEDDNTAKKAGVISGLSEAISEQFFDGMPGLKSQGWGGKLTGKVANSLEKTFGTKTGKIFMKLANAGGEGVEEIISNTITAVSNDIVHKIDNNYTYGMENQTGNILEDALNSVTSEESLKSAAIAAMTSAILGGGQAAISTAERNTLLREYARENNITFEEAKKQFENTVASETNAMSKGNSFEERMDIESNIRKQELENIKNRRFVEQGQRDKAFQYKETDNEQVNNMLRSLSEKGNNTTQNHATAQTAEKLIRDLGLNIEFTNSEELRAKGLPEADGYKEGNKLVLNLNSNKLSSYVMGHETTHFLENQGELYDAVSKAVFDLATTKGIHDGEVAKIKKLYANIIDNKVNEEMQNKGRALTEQEINKITDDIVRSELTANYVGEFFTDEEFFRTLGKENPSILQRLAEFFDELLSKITGNTERQQIHEAKRKIKKVYAEYMNGGQINLENSQEAQIRNKVITEQKKQDSINIPTKQETTQKQEINKSSEVNLPTAEKIENKIEENAQKNENTVQKIEKTEENIPTKTKIDNEEGIKKIKEKYDTTEKVTGSKKTIVLSNGEKLSGTYKLIEAGNVSASHNAETFEKTEGFPTTENGTTVNDRDYQSDKNAQNLVTQKSDNFDGRAFADNGVIVTKDGIVVSGNDRTMSGDLAAKKGTDTAYIEYLKDNASQFGFTVEQIDNMKHPRVVLELNKKLPYDTKTFAMFNKDAKKSKSVSERAKEIGKTIDEDTINSVSEIIDNFDTIDDLYNNEKATRELISLMQTKNIIDSNDLSDVYNGSKFTGSGKDLVESVILGSVINEDNAKYFSNNNDLKFKVMKAAPALIQNKTLNDYSINELFNNAVEVYKKASSSKMTLDEFTSQSNIFGDNDVDLVTKRIAQLLETKGYKNLRNFIEKYNAMAEFPASGQTDIFSGGQVETKEDILRKALNIDDNTEIQYLISDRQYNVNDFARRFAKATNYKDEISMDFISKVANAYAYGEYDPNYNYTNVDDIEDSKFANDLIEKIKFELDKKGYHLNELEDKFVKNDRQYMLNDYEEYKTEQEEYRKKLENEASLFLEDWDRLKEQEEGSLKETVLKDTLSRPAKNINDDFFKQRWTDFDKNQGKSADGDSRVFRLQKGDNEAKLSITENEDTIWIDELYIKNQKSGYGKEIVDAIKKYATDNNKSITTYKEVGNAREFWNKMFGESKNEFSHTWYPIQDKQYMLSDTDNQGKKLTKEQQEYFKDSKVVDENGNLKVVYRGSSTEKSYTVFDKNRAGSNGVWYGSGFYFAGTKEHALTYAKNNSTENLYEVYLNIKNPYIIDNDIVKADGSIEFAPSFYEQIENKFSNYLPSDWKDINNFQKGNAAVYALQDNGYDGVIAGDTYVAFEPNQIKNIDNTNPTTNEDIRYMLSDTDNQGNKISKGMANYMDESKARDENGNLVMVYHGSKKAGFTVFSTIDGVSFYTDDKDVARTYSGSKEMVDTKKLNSIEEAQNWLDELGIADLTIIENNGKYGYEFSDKKYVVVDNDISSNENSNFGDELIGGYKNEEELLRGLKRNIQTVYGNDDAGGNYEGYVNIKNPLIVDVETNLWSQIPVDNIPIENAKELLDKKYYREKGKLRTSTNDIVSIALKSGKYDGVIFKNINDEGIYNNDKKTKTVSNVYVTFNSNQFKAADNLNPTSDPDIRYMLSDKGEMVDKENGEKVTFNVTPVQSKLPIDSDKSLMVMHNLGEKKMNGILDLGGIPAPSIAVTDPNIVDHNGFGDISLLFDKSTIDPTDIRNEVYDRDIWSPTQPQIDYNIDKNSLEEVSNKLGIRTYDLEDFAENNSTPEYLADRLSRVEEIVDKYVKDNNIEYEEGYKKPEIRVNFNDNDNIRNFVIDNDFDVNKLVNNENLKQKYFELIKEFYDKSPLQGMAQQAYKDKIEQLNNFIDTQRGAGDGIVRVLKRYQDDFETIKSGENKIIDEWQTNKNKKEAALNNGLKEYLVNETQPLFTEKGIYNGKDYLTPSGKRRSFWQLHDEYNLENLVDALTKGETTGSEKTLVTGYGQIQAKMSNKFNSIEDIKNAKNQLMPEAEAKKITEEYSNAIAEDIEELGKYMYDSMFSFDNASNLIFDYASEKIHNEESFMKNAKEYGINRVPTELINKINSDLENLKNIPTDYFEAKPQRAVGLDEIQAAIIPNNTSVELKKRINDAGINYYEYDPTIEGDRNRVINQFNDLKFMLKGDEMSGIYTPKNQFTNRLSDGLIQENLPTEEATNLPISNTNNEEENIFEKPTRRQVIDRNRQLAREQLGDITKIKDKKKGINYQLNTMKRNLRDIMSPEQAKSMYETYFRPITENNARIENDITSYNERIQKYNLNNEESVYTQMLGELRYNPDSELTSQEVNDYYNKNSRKIDAGKVDKAIEEFRSIYDELIGRVNQTLTANGYKEIEYRQGYFPHFIEEKATSPIGKFAEKLGWKVKSGQLPTDIAGITDQFKPGKTWTTFSQHRTGDATDYNALKGLDNYLRGAMDVIHHTNDIQKLRALENEIRYQYSEKGIKEKIDSIYADDTLDMEEKNDAIYTLTNNMRNSGLGNFVTEIRNYTDNLANKKAFGDRSMEQQFGRDTYSIMQNINSRVSANMVGGNISSALTNFIPITQAWSQLSTKNLMKGMYESIKTSIKDDGFANNSVYLTNRTKQADRLYKSGIDKINDKLGIPFEAIDSFASNTIVRAKYHDNIEKGMSEREAIRNADEFAKDVMAGRSKGDMPTIMNQKNPLVKLMTAFQLEVNNQYGYMFKDIPADLGDEAKRKLVGAFIKMFFGAWLYNQLSEKVTGRKSAFSPVDMAIDDIKTASNENLDLGDKISAIAKDTAQELPFVGGLLGGGRLPIQSAIPYENPLEMVTGTISDVSKTFDEDETKKKNAIKKLMKEWSKPVYYVAMPFGGGQIKKTIEGISMYNENLPVAGSYTDSGKLRFEAPEDTLGKLQAAVFGQYASKNAREYFDNGYQPLTEKQINTALDAGLNINEYREYNSGIKAQENNNDKINYINNLPLENEQKNVLANDVLKRKEKVDISNYGNYGSLEEFDYANKNPGKYNAITQITDFNSYNKYKDEINAIKDQYDDTNERKQAVFSYINSLELNKYQKLMLQKLASGYSIKNYKREMQNYINSLELSAAEKQQIDDALFK